MSDAPTWDSLRARWPNAEHSRFVTVGDARWHVQVAGSGPVVLLLHGAGSANFSWRDVFPALATSCTVIAPDLPGHGFTDAGRDALSIGGMARAVRALLDALAVEPVVVAGHSAGGALAVRMALDGALRARAIVGFGAALVPPQGTHAKLLAPWLASFAATPAMAWIASRVATIPGVVETALGGTGSPVSAEQRALYAAFFRSAKHCAGAFAMMAGWDLEALVRDVPRLTTPLRLVHGARDHFVPLGALRATVATVPGARLDVIEGAGHLLHEERPALAVAAIGEALQETSARRD